MSSNPIGEIPVIITGDYSDLSESIDQASSVAETGAQAIGTAFTEGAGAAKLAVDEFIASLNEGIDEKFGATTAAEAAAAQKQLADSLAQTAEAAKAADDFLGSTPGFRQAEEMTQRSADALEGLKQQYRDTQDAAQGLDSQVGELNELLSAGVTFGGITLGAAALKDFAAEALSSFDAVQKADISLNALTGDAQHAESVISAVEDIAKTQPFSFPELAGAAQKMVAFGIASSQVPGILQAAADASRATGNSFDSVASAIERVAVSGAITARQLYSLGINWEDLAKQAGVSVDEVQALVKKGGQSAEEDLTLLVDTVQAKFQSLEEAPLTIGQAWQVLQNQVTTVFQAIGAGLEPLAEAFIGLLHEAILPLGLALSQDFAAGTAAVKDLAVGVGSLLTPELTALKSLVGAGLNWSAFLPGVQFTEFLNSTTALLRAMNLIPAAAQPVVTNFHDVATATNLAVVSQANLSEGAQEVVQHMQDLRDRVANTTAIYNELVKSSNGSAEAQQAVQRASVDVTNAQVNLQNALKTTKGMVDDNTISEKTLAATYADNLTAAAGATKIWNDLFASYAAGTKSIGEITEAQKTLEGIMNSVTGGIKSATQQQQDFTIKQDASLQSLKNEAVAYTQLAQTIGTGEPAMLKMLADIGTKADALGVGFTDLGIKAVSFGTEIIKSGVSSAPALDDVRKNLLAVANAAGAAADKAKGLGDSVTTAAAHNVSGLEADTQGVKVLGDQTNDWFTNSISDLGTMDLRFNTLNNTVKVNGDTVVAANSSMAGAYKATDDIAQTLAYHMGTLGGISKQTWTDAQLALMPYQKALIDAANAEQELAKGAADVGDAVVGAMANASQAVAGFISQVTGAWNAMIQLGAAVNSIANQPMQGAQLKLDSSGSPGYGGDYIFQQIASQAQLMDEVVFGTAKGGGLYINPASSAVAGSGSGTSSGSTTAAVQSAINSTSSTSSTSAATTTTGNPLLDWLNSFSTAITGANAATTAGSADLPSWVTDLTTALQGVTSATTTGTSLPDWVQQLATVIQQATGGGSNVIDLTSLGNAVQGILSEVPGLTTATTTATAAVTNLSTAVAAAGVTASQAQTLITATTADLTRQINASPSVGPAASNLSLTNPLPSSAATGAAGFQATAPTSPVSSGWGTYVNNINVAGSPQLNQLATQMITLLQRSGVRP